MSKYRIVVVYSSEQGQFIARVPELGECEAIGATRTEALTNVEAEIEAQVKNIEGQGETPPIPLEEQNFDGELKFKISSSLHRDLAFMAQEERVELDALITELLSRSVAQRYFSKGFRGKRANSGDIHGRRRDEGQGRRYHDIMENRADFIEYVRGLENGKGRGSGRGGRGGGRGGRS